MYFPVAANGGCKINDRSYEAVINVHSADWEAFRSYLEALDFHVKFLLRQTIH